MTDPPRYRFPGMDPWLEHPAIWPDVHHRLITYFGDELAARIEPNYTARHGERLVVESSRREVVPDVVVSVRRPGFSPAAATATIDEPLVVLLPAAEYREPFLEIRDRRSGNRVVTVIEILSPSNTRPGTDARKKYAEKQSELLSSDVSLMEIDLLRAGEHTVAVPESVILELDSCRYRIVTRRARRPEEAEIYRIPLPQRLPRLRIPLSEPDPDVVVDLQPLVERVYRAGGYGIDLDYAKAPVPPLEPADLDWARTVLAGNAAMQ